MGSSELKGRGGLTDTGRVWRKGKDEKFGVWRDEREEMGMDEVKGERESG